MAKLTEEHYAAIPGLIAEGYDKHQIAIKFGVKASTLQVRCSQRKISLRRCRPMKDGAKTIRVGVDVVRMFETEATTWGISATDLAKEMLTVIARDNLFNAVLDWRSQ